MLQLTDKHRQNLARFTDIRFVGQLVFVAIVLLISWKGVEVIHTNYQLQQQIARLQQENANQKLQNENDALKNDYYKSAQYLELSARQNYGLAAPGEKELIVPKAVALAHLPPDVAKAADSAQAAPDTRPFYARNTQAWFDFFLHRTPENTVSNL